MAESTTEGKIKKDLIDAATDVFEPTEFGYEYDEKMDVLVAEEYSDEGEVIARYAVSITIDLDKLNGH